MHSVVSLLSVFVAGITVVLAAPSEEQTACIVECSASVGANAPYAEFYQACTASDDPPLRCPCYDIDFVAAVHTCLDEKPNCNGAREAMVGFCKDNYATFPDSASREEKCFSTCERIQAVIDPDFAFAISHCGRADPDQANAHHCTCLEGDDAVSSVVACLDSHPSCDGVGEIQSGICAGTLNYTATTTTPGETSTTPPPGSSTPGSTTHAPTTPPPGSGSSTATTTGTGTSTGASQTPGAAVRLAAPSVGLLALAMAVLL